MTSRKQRVHKWVLIASGTSWAKANPSPTAGENWGYEGWSKREGKEEEREGKEEGTEGGGKVTRDWENNEEKKNCQKKRENKR